MATDDECVELVASTGSVDVPLETVIDLWKLVASLGVSLAELGRGEALDGIDGDATSDDYREFLIEFDITRKLLAARHTLDPLLEQHPGVESVDRVAETIEYWSR